MAQKVELTVKSLSQGSVAHGPRSRTDAAITVRTESWVGGTNKLQVRNEFMNTNSNFAGPISIARNIRWRIFGILKVCLLLSCAIASASAAEPGRVTELMTKALANVPGKRCDKLCPSTRTLSEIRVYFDNTIVTA
jgi:hypothetical protein